MLIIGIILFGMIAGAGAQLVLQRGTGINWPLAFVTGIIGSFVGGLFFSFLSGDGLNLRAAGHFDSTRLEAWANDSVARLVNALPTMGASALQAIATALQPVLPAGVTAAAASGTLTVTAGASVALAWRPSPFRSA